MKIDEKVMSYYESSNTPVDKEGYLYKKGEIKTSYQRRWFVLKGNLLFYKDKSSDRDLVGVIVLEGCTVQLCESDEQFAFSLVWTEPGLRTYKLAAEDQQSLESWIKTLLSASHCYLALLLKDMERVYREASGKADAETTKTNPFVMPYFPLSEGHVSSSPHLQSPSSQNHFSSSGPALGPGLNSGPALGPGLNPGSMLQPSAAISTKPSPKRSPKLKKKAMNAVSAQPSAQFFENWVPPEAQEDFTKLHTEYGEEVRKLISRWAKRRPDGQQDLIDFD